MTSMVRVRRFNETPQHDLVATWLSSETEAKQTGLDVRVVTAP